MLLESHSVVALVNVDGVLSGHYLADGRIALLLATRLSGSRYAGPNLESQCPFLMSVLACSLPHWCPRGPVHTEDPGTVT